VLSAVSVTAHKGIRDKFLQKSSSAWPITACSIPFTGGRAQVHNLNSELDRKETEHHNLNSE
jgi:hypothetical protein